MILCKHYNVQHRKVQPNLSEQQWYYVGTSKPWLNIDYTKPLRVFGCCRHETMREMNASAFRLRSIPLESKRRSKCSSDIARQNFNLGEQDANY